jgi:putative nucleotidyltransferase with HDIG domain
MNRAEAHALLTEYTTKNGLIKHALAVEGAMRDYAKKAGEDEESWGIVGLVHDFDYERYPSAEAGHPYKGVEILREKGVPAEWVDAVLGHGGYTGVKRVSAMARTLFAVDELTGFIVAVALVRPDRKLEGVSVQSVKKKMKDKAFAASVSREDIVKGAEEIGVPLDEHIDFVLASMKRIATELGL